MVFVIAEQRDSYSEVSVSDCLFSSGYRLYNKGGLRAPSSMGGSQLHENNLWTCRTFNYWNQRV